MREKSFDMPACVIVKHANPCGVAVDADLTNAYQKPLPLTQNLRLAVSFRL